MFDCNLRLWNRSENDWVSPTYCTRVASNLTVFRKFLGLKVSIRENTDQKKTPYLEIFHAVISLNIT